MVVRNNGLVQLNLKVVITFLAHCDTTMHTKFANMNDNDSGESENLGTSHFQSSL